MTNDKIYKAAKKYATKNMKPHFTSDINTFMAGAEYALSHQWISVKDEMPRKYVDVFVLYKYGSVGVAYVDATETFSQNDVAFWMPIPPIGKKS